ncbi:hypothetical protein JXA85_00985 [Candidatus Woesearchaeota archaeon]|nr:hypothetical protein [Candidatus Woesearchaeota archaeon]
MNTKIEIAGAILLTGMILFGFVSLEERSPHGLERITGRAVSKVFVLEKVLLDCNISLEENWNLIEVHCIPLNSSIDNMFQSHLGDIRSIHGYDPLDPDDKWKTYASNLPSWVVQDLTSIERRKGYWVDMSLKENITINGYYIQPLTVYLYQGWNLLGYPLDDSLLINESFSSISGKYSMIYAYYAYDTVDPWKIYDPDNIPLNDLENFTPLYGYWVNMTENASWLASTI